MTTKERNQFFLDTLSNQQADIMVLTETNDIINPGEAFSAAHSLPLPESFENFAYRPGERRVSLYSRYPLSRGQHTLAAVASALTSHKFCSRH